jgi:hypothetical protein
LRVRGLRSGRSLVVAAPVVALAVIALWNARSYPPTNGYDAVHHIAYAELLLDAHRIPGPADNVEYDTPPGFYAVAAAGTWAGRHAHLPEPRRAVQLVNVALVVATALLTLGLARIVAPGRTPLHAAAVGFASLLPVVVKTAGMYHPETLDLALSTLGLLLAARMLATERYALGGAVALGVVLGAAQLVRAFALWTLAAVTIAFVVAAAWRADRRPILTALAVTVAASAVVAGPWYVRQTVDYGSPLPFDRPAPDEPVWSRRPVSFYLGLGLPDVATRPYRPAYVNEAIPTTYTEVWGDWFGSWAWTATEGDPSASVRRELVAQNVVGLVPTVLAVAGWILLAAAILRRRLLPAVPVVLLPALGLLGYLAFTISYPSSDGDVLKATYLLTTAPAWAIAFGAALDRLWSRERLRVPLALVLVACALVNVRFLVHGAPLGGLL